MASQSNPSQEAASQPDQSDQHQTDTAELFSSAKVVAAAAQSTFQHETGKIDKAELSDASGDLLGAVSGYAKLDQTSYGKYVTQAEDYLHQQSSSRPLATATTPAPPATEESSEAKQESGDEESKRPSTDPSGEDQSGGASVDDPKMAKGFLKNSSSQSTDSEGEGKSGGVGDYLKMAQGFFKKN